MFLLLLQLYNIVCALAEVSERFHNANMALTLNLYAESPSTLYEKKFHLSQDREAASDCWQTHSAQNQAKAWLHLFRICFPQVGSRDTKF